MKIAVIGNDGRALSVKDRLVREHNELIQIDVLDDIDAILPKVEWFKPDLIVTTRIETAQSGVTDKLRSLGYGVFGVSKQYGRMEYSKAYGKKIAKEMGFNLPDAMYFTADVHSIEAATNYVCKKNKAYTIKPDGITGGKGVIVCHTVEDTLLALHSSDLHCMDFVIEETLIGNEVSFEFWVSGGEVLPMVLNLEYKKSHDGELGVLTAGMATVQSNDLINPCLGIVSLVYDAVQAWVHENDFYGPMYITFIRERSGLLKFLEFNVRLQDPEFEVMECMIKSSLTDLFVSMAYDLPLHPLNVELDHGYGVGITVVAGGYPHDNACKQGLPIYCNGKQLTDVVAKDNGIKRMGAITNNDGGWITKGGRQFTVCKVGMLDNVFADIYKTLSNIDFMEMVYRTDIKELTKKRLEKLVGGLDL